MRFKNKKTGEIGWLYCDHISQKKITVFAEERNLSAKHWDYASLADLNAEWEDAPEEPKEYWFINPEGEVTSMHEEHEDEEDTKATKEIGNYFLSREEAEKAVRKLQAWKRLKDKGFRFKDYKRKFDGFRRVDGSVFIEAELDDEGTIGMINELSICFGGEE